MSFEARLDLGIKKVSEDGVQEKGFCDTVITWHGLSYDGVVAIEAVMLDALNKLNDLGMSQCEDGSVAEFAKEVKKR